MSAWLRVSLGLGLIVMVVVLLIAFGLSRGLQRQVSQPIVALADIARAVAARQDYSVRAIKRGEDEVGLLTDSFNQMLTQIQEQSQALHERERRFRALIEHSSDGIVVIDADNNITYASPSVQAVEGYAAEELVGRNGVEQTHPDDLTLVKAIVGQLLARPGQPIPVLWRRRHKSGRWLWLEGVATNLLADPAIRGIVTNYRDVTERKQAEDDIRQLNASLDQRVVARTAELQAVNHELEAFSYSVSHDLRAPLRHIDGFAGLLLKNSAAVLNDQGRRYLATISASARQMGRLIDDLLSFSRMGRTQLELAEVDQTRLVAAIIRDGGYEANSPALTWELGPLPGVRVDQILLRQVWINLLDNAVKYSAKVPAPRIAIGHQPGATAGEQVFFVRDNGAGFDMRYVDKLFGVFQRLHGPTEFEGTGIGLANVRRIITRHGGRTWAEGQVGEGATFYFSLPALPTQPS